MSKVGGLPEVLVQTENLSMWANCMCRFDGIKTEQGWFYSLFLRNGRPSMGLGRLFRRAAAFCFLATAAQAASIFDIRIADELNRVVDTNITVLTTNATVTVGSSTILEGPTWIPGIPGYLIFSAFNNNSTWDANGRLKKLVLPNTVTDYLPVAPPMGTVYNGSTLDMQERIISCQSGSNGLRVVMITNDSVVTTLVATCGGLKFYSPNDVVVKSDGTIWFTDPAFNSGIPDGTTGFVTGHNVYRFNPSNGNATCTAVINFSTSYRPNGLCFSPDESLLYLADWGNRRILVYSVSSSNTLSGGSTLATLTTGNNPDGIRCDADGRIYSSSASGIWIYLPDGRLIGRILTTKGVANLCFGGTDRYTLFMTASPHVLSIPLKVTGAVWRKKLQVIPGGGSSVRVAWPWPSAGFQLQASSSLGTGIWTPVPDSPSVSTGLNILSFNPTNSAAFFRLQIPNP